MLARIQQELREETASHADATDQAVASYDKNALHRQAEQASAQLRMLGDALRRMDDGKYGECVICGKDIAIPRLKAIPWAKYCIDCQEFQEGFSR